MKHLKQYVLYDLSSCVERSLSINRRLSPQRRMLSRARTGTNEEKEGQLPERGNNDDLYLDDSTEPLGVTAFPFTQIFLPVRSPFRFSRPTNRIVCGNPK